MRDHSPTWMDLRLSSPDLTGVPTHICILLRLFTEIRYRGIPTEHRGVYTFFAVAEKEHHWLPAKFHEITAMRRLVFPLPWLCRV